MGVNHARFDDEYSDNLIKVRPMKERDWDEVRAIYLQGISTRNSTFETIIPDWDDWNENHLKHSRFVAEANGQVVGWIALSPYSRRVVYQGVAEISIYIDPSFNGRGIGSELMKIVMKSAVENHCWMLQASTFPENKASIGLHKKFGFREVGYRERIAQLDGKWRNVVLLEKRL